MMARATRWSPFVVLLLVGSGLVGCADVLDSLKSASKPTARISEARLSDLSLRDVTLVFDVDVGNPYGVDLPLLDVGYALSTQGDPFVEGSADIGGFVPAGGSKTVSLPVVIDFLQTLDLVKRLRPGQVVPYRASLTLSVDPPGLEPLGLPLATEGAFPIPDVPEVEVASIRWDELSLSRVGGTVELDVTNPNAFDLELTDLSYSLALAGTRVAEGSTQPATALPSESTRQLALPIGFSPVSLGAAVYGVVTGSEAPYELRGNLSVETPFGALELPVSSVGEARFLR